MGRSPMTSEEQADFDEQIDVLRQNMDTGQFEQRLPPVVARCISWLSMKTTRIPKKATLLISL
jgi:hypothetical protein